MPTKDISAGLPEIQDGISEAIQRSTILHGRRVMACPCSYESRAQLLWSASLAITHLSDCGREYAGCVHSIEHALSAFLDISMGSVSQLPRLHGSNMHCAMKQRQRFAGGEGTYGD